MSHQMIKLANMGKECNTGLGLGIGGHEEYCTSKKNPLVQFHMLFPPKQEEEEEEEEEKPKKRAKNIDKEKQEDMVEDKGGSTRKKLKLTKEQATLLEDSFREHYTLNMTQKQELATRLKLSPRQIEVWFQNRRARNKSKKTEVDCEMLRKWCKSLSDENQRLKVELQELNLSTKPTYVELPKAAAMLTICPSCERTTTAGGGRRGRLGDFSMAC